MRMSIVVIATTGTDLRVWRRSFFLLFFPLQRFGRPAGRASFMRKRENSVCEEGKHDQRLEGRQCSCVPNETMLQYRG